MIVLYGGRGGIKSWSVAQSLLIEGTQKPLRILCARELQKSIGESVHHLLCLQIERLGLQGFYTVEQSKIYGPNGTEFFFSGLRDAANLKSYESVDRCWIEEAANVSKRSWDMLLPTIRKPGSRVIVTFNPELSEDETYKRFVLKPPPGAVVVKTSYHDNPWLSQELRAQIEHLRNTDQDAYLCVYEGHCKQTLDGAIYADEIRALTARDGITSVPYTPGKPVAVFFDLGIADETAMWFVQPVAYEWRFIDFYQNRNKAWTHYLEVLQERKYLYSHLWLPHDGKRRDLGTGKSIEQITREAGHKVKIVPQIGIKNGMDAARNLFARAYFDETKCAEGLTCLRRYRWKVDPDTQIFSKEPLHDSNSNGADAFRYAAVGLTEPERPRDPLRPQRPARVSAWS